LLTRGLLTRASDLFSSPTVREAYDFDGVLRVSHVGAGPPSGQALRSKSVTPDFNQTSICSNQDASDVNANAVTFCEGNPLAPAASDPDYRRKSVNWRSGGMGDGDV